MLEEGGQEDEELHSGQSLTGTSPGTCRRQEWAQVISQLMEG